MTKQSSKIFASINDWEDQFSLNPNTQKGKHVAQGHFQTLTTTQLQNINHLSVSKSQPNVNLKILKGILHFYLTLFKNSKISPPPFRFEL